jgi:7-carboxy-7-deazaguanine synthase
VVVVTRNRQGVKTFSVIEIFGPTIQGEGAEAGLPTHFVRLGGCDYRCSWCDTMYAVEPSVVRATAQRLSSEEIVDALAGLAGAPRWVTISGGNPALHQLGPLIDQLHARGYRIGVETQGSVWRPWLGDMDRLTVSPKPPSSGMATTTHERQFVGFMAKALASRAAPSLTLKVVCFDEIDLGWAKQVRRGWPDVPLFLSVGTPVPSQGSIRDAVGDGYRWLCEQVAADVELSEARVLPQLHVVAWGDRRGV